MYGEGYEGHEFYSENGHEMCDCDLCYYRRESERARRKKARQEAEERRAAAAHAMVSRARPEDTKNLL